MNTALDIFSLYSKRLLPFLALFVAACSTNPATGKQQFTALMSPQQEIQVGAQEHKNIVKQFGLYKDKELNDYVSSVGRRVSKKTERPDVQYTFYVLDSPIVNAFALPGGYIYLSRGLLALADNEAQMASVLAHEIGHVTGRHSAERYSTGVLTSLGAGLLSAALDSSSASQALGVGSNLFMSSYSRDQENEADSLGVRYLSHGHYDPGAMAGFLSKMQAHGELEGRLHGKAPQFSYFSTHPATGERVSRSIAEAQNYKQGGAVARDEYLQKIDGMVFGDSAEQGLVRGESFYHPGMNFTFSVPKGFRLINRPTQVIGTSKSGAVIVFDMAGRKSGADPLSYLTQVWMKNEKLSQPERIKINGMDAATASFAGKVNNKPVTIRLVTIAWTKDRFVRYQIAIPQNAPASLVEDLKRSSYSFRAMNAEEKRTVKPYKIKIVTAKAGDTVKSLARQQVFDKLQEDHFRVYNGLGPNDQLIAGRRYKLITSF